MERQRKIIYTNIIIGIVILLSFLIIDLVMKSLLAKQVFNISSILFTLSWIALLLGILVLVKKKSKIILYSVISLLVTSISYLEYLYFQKEQKYLLLNEIFSIDWSSYLKYTDLKIIILCVSSILITILTIYFINKQKELKLSLYSVIITILVTFITFSGLRGIAIMSLGPEVVRSSNRIEETDKNIYLYDINRQKKLEISGFYEYIFQDLKEDFLTQLNKNNKKIEKKYN